MTYFQKKMLSILYIYNCGIFITSNLVKRNSFQRRYSKLFFLQDKNCPKENVPLNIIKLENRDLCSFWSVNLIFYDDLWEGSDKFMTVILAALYNTQCSILFRQTRSTGKSKSNRIIYNFSMHIYSINCNFVMVQWLMVTGGVQAIDYASHI